MQNIILTPLDYIIVLPFIFIAGFIDSIAGGGGLISLPAYWSAGIPPHLALGTNKFSSCCGTLFSTANYFKAKMIDIPVALVSSGMAIIGSWLGASTALQISSHILNYLLIILIPIVTVFSLLNRNLGMHSKAEYQQKDGVCCLGDLQDWELVFMMAFSDPGQEPF